MQRFRAEDEVYYQAFLTRKLLDPASGSDTLRQKSVRPLALGFCHGTTPDRPARNLRSRPSSFGISVRICSPTGLFRKDCFHFIGVAMCTRQMFLKSIRLFGLAALFVLTLTVSSIAQDTNASLSG